MIQGSLSLQTNLLNYPSNRGLFYLNEDREHVFRIKHFAFNSKFRIIKAIKAKMRYDHFFSLHTTAELKLILMFAFAALLNRRL